MYVLLIICSFMGKNTIYLKTKALALCYWCFIYGLHIHL